MRRRWLLLLLLVVADTRARIPELPPIPESAPTAIGPIPIRRVPHLRCKGVPASGCFHGDGWFIEIQDSIPLTAAWQSTEHELVHEALYLNGVVFDDPRDEDKLAEIVANQRVLELRAGWPR
jgi:hypothetical protein